MQHVLPTCCVLYRYQLPAVEVNRAVTLLVACDNEKEAEEQ